MGPRYNTYVAPGRNTSGHHSKPCSRIEYVSSLTSPVQSACYLKDVPPYPTIRRVQSLHAPPSSTIRSVPSSQTEVPPDDEATYCPRPLYQYKPHQSSQACSDYHVTQLQPYFENGWVQYHYSPYSSSSSSCYSPNGALCDVDAYSTVQLRPLHHLPSRDFALYNPRLQGKNLYSYPGLPVSLVMTIM
ncbi:Rho/Cdc42/Rac GTPase-activating protein RICS [Heterocephalus glaber]|uniref:Rho/Cdc42/Rac GTPase-activating protein RICS n=1 Tax=Heterocephalus glaber TaxID=10181 RepID=G5AY73_HETGA|nr:Rho/Cdc42/Rac GTPase-activating protein RICS [Heterocephalus glaber]